MLKRWEIIKSDLNFSLILLQKHEVKITNFTEFQGYFSATNCAGAVYHDGLKEIWPLENTHVGLG